MSCEVCLDEGITVVVRATRKPTLSAWGGERDKANAQLQRLQLAVCGLVHRDGGDAQYISRRIVVLVDDVCWAW